MNDSVGEKVNVTLFNSDDSSTINTELYFDIQMEIFGSIAPLYDENKGNINESTNEKNFYIYFDYGNNIGYVNLKNLSNSQGKKLRTTLESMEEFNNIIIYLRL